MDYREDSKKIIKTTAYILAVISATSIIIYTVYAANTTIGTNITTSGNLTVGGASSLASATLSGNLTFSSSATTTIPNSAVNAFSFATSTSAEPLLSFTTSGQGHIGIGAVATTSAKLFIADIEATGTPPSSVSSGGNSRAPMIWVSSASDLPLIGIENTAADVRTALISGNISSPGAGGYLGTLSNHPLYFFTNDETRMALLANGYFGIGTSSPSQALSVHGNALFSGNLNVANVTATGTLTLTGTSGTSTINSITIGPNGKFGFSTTTPNIANFEVATRTIAFNSGADGSLGSWQTNPSVLPSFHSFGLSTIVANGYVYAIGGSSVSNSITAGTVTTYSAVDRAKLNSDGSIGAWQTDSNALPLAIGEHSSVAANGYVYAIGGAWGIGFGGATGQSAVYYAKLNSDGSTGAWKTNTNALPAALAAHTSVVANGYVYAIGGSSGGVLQSTVYYAKLNSDGSTGAWKTNANALTLPRYRHSSAVANGYVYVIGGYETPALPGADARVATIYYAKLNNDGSIGAWATNANSLPGVLDKHTSVVANGYVYVIGGANDIGTQVAVYYAKLNNNGSIGAWQTNSNSLTAARVSHSSVVANGYVYVFGSAFGVDIYYASTARTLISGNLDLLGLANTTLSDASGDGSLGSIGSSIFAGNIFSAGTLEVSGNTQLFGGLGVNGLLSVNASTSGQQNVPIFSIQNATGTSPILTAQYDGKVGIGTTSLASALEIQKPSSGSVFNISNNLNGDLLTINNSGYLGIGTTTPGALLSVQGNALFSGNLSLANLTATGTISVSGTSGTSTIGSITIGPNGKFGFSTTTPNIANFEVATRTIAFNSGADGALGSWATTNAFPAVRESHSSVIANGYVYVIGGSNDGGSTKQSTVYYAKLNSDGSTGAWSTNANALPANRWHPSSVVANGYVYVIGGAATAQSQSTVYYAKLNSDGSTGAWSTNANALPEGRESHSSVIANGYVYVIGGSNMGSLQSTVYYAKLNSDGSTGAWSTNANALLAVRGDHSSVVANGYAYVIGGNDGPIKQSTVYYAKLNSDGSTGAWSTNANALPGGSYTLSSVIANGYAYVIGGHDGTTAQSTVYYAKLNSDGSTGAWSTNANALPLVRYSHSSVVANGYVYVIGGNGGSTVSTVYYASTARVLISGNLDLLGLASTTLSDASGDGSLGSIGSSIFAGNIFSAGTLEVSGNTQLFGGLGVNGLLSVNASTSLNQNVPIFSIQNATGTLPLFSLAYNGGLGIGTTSPFSGTLIMNGNVGIGTTTPGALLSVQGNALFSGNLSLANLIATGTLGVGTTTNGSYATIAAESQNSTTTLYLASTRSDRAGCIQLEGPASTTYRMYIGDTGSGAALITQAGSCDGN